MGTEGRVRSAGRGWSIGLKVRQGKLAHVQAASRRKLTVWKKWEGGRESN